MSNRLPCVLVVEDDPVARELLKEAIEAELGVRVVLAANGAEALRLLAEHCPQVVVTDARMPVMNGIELIRRLRRRPATYCLPVIVVTASLWLRHDALVAGADAYVDKPFDLDVLVRKIAQYVE
ncbi:MAG: response regulator [Chloroflexi bacterium]|nr:response regulator [Chloroflexota bacterium]MCL5109405.1 response regulator [Chloroflexota bacterium]